MVLPLPVSPTKIKQSIITIYFSHENLLLDYFFKCNDLTNNNDDTIVSDNIEKPLSYCENGKEFSLLLDCFLLGKLRLGLLINLHVVRELFVVSEKTSALILFPLQVLVSV